MSVSLKAGTVANDQKVVEYATYESAEYNTAEKSSSGGSLEGEEQFPIRGAELPVIPLQGYLLKWFVRFVRAKKILEVGTFTGYSTVFLADALRKNGVEADESGSKPLITCEMVEEAAEAAQKNFTKLGYDDLIEVKVQKAIDTINAFPDGTQFDLIFIDADKPSYQDYYDTILNKNLLSPNGIMVIDNTILFGIEKLVGQEPESDFAAQKNAIEEWQIASKDSLEKKTAMECKGAFLDNLAKTAHAFNEFVRKDPRTEQLVLPLVTGMTFVRLAN
ncbi:hypothetical protein H4219_001009 [Mycoemilia scoparia]|uniref:O-methyltransferase n=1 Tax=Mycoemilia scoparia TaxID=417184 RepID=A0A9W8DQY0_9FUNG|nr:hypothetical protein H4219_001009 [Mycoemilia scoparia]